MDFLFKLQFAFYLSVRRIGEKLKNILIKFLEGTGRGSKNSVLYMYFVWKIQNFLAEMTK